MEHNEDFLFLGQLMQELTPAQLVQECISGAKQDCGDNVGRDSPPLLVSFDEALPVSSRSPRSEISILSMGSDYLNAFNADNFFQFIKGDSQAIDEALNVFQSALKSHKEKFGNNHHLVGSTLHNIGTLHLFAKQYTKAQVALEEAVLVREELYNSEDACASLMKIALVQLAMGDCEAAETCFWDIRDQLIDDVGFGHPQVPKIMNNIGVVACCNHDLKGAIRYLEIAHQYQLRRRETNTVLTASILENLGYCCAKQQAPMKALAHYEAALNLYKEAQDSDHNLRCLCVQNNIRCLLSRKAAWNWPSLDWTPPGCIGACIS
jgi:tetratricopeptide (TPR) repeat protein